MRASLWFVLATVCTLPLSGLAATDRPTATDDANPVAAGKVEHDAGRQVDGAPTKLQAAMGTFTVTGAVNAVAVTEEAVWAIVTVSPRKRLGLQTGALPTHALIRSDIASGHAADLGKIGGFAAAALAIAEGSVWAAEGAGGEKVHRIDPKTGKIIASVSVSRNPSGLAHGAGAIWVAAADKVNKAGSVLLSVRGWALYRIDPATNQIVASVTVPTSEPPANTWTPPMIEFASGAVWAGDAWTGSVVRIDPTDNRVVATIEGPRTGSADARRYFYSLHAAGDRPLLKRVGVKASRGAYTVVTDVKVWQIDPNANRLSSEPAQLVRDGAVLGFVDGVAWLGNTGVDGLTRVDPRTLQELAKPLMIGHPVKAIAGGCGSLLAIESAGRTAEADGDRSRVTRVLP